MPVPRKNTPRLPTTAEQHAEWLGLLRPEGPFLALLVLNMALPQGLETVPDETRTRIRQAWAEVSEAPDLLGPAWQELIIGELLRYPASALRDGAALVGEWGFQPDAIVSGPNPAGGLATRLHIYRRGFDEPLTAAVYGEPALVERAAQLCRDTRVPLALLTNGRFWVLVHARPGEATSTAVFDADLWLEEPMLLRAFASLCSASRVLPPSAAADGAPSTSLAGLFARSADDHAHVTTTLGLQVRQAVELFVAELARLDREAGGALLRSVSERDIYRGALTALMRLVFLLFAEEQRLLPVTDPIYAGGYAVSTLYEQLEAERNLHGDEVSDLRRAAWPRLLALFRAIHGGCEHPDLWIPAYGGSLFDPYTYPWLEEASVTDRVIREMLDALLVLRHRGKAAERLSYARLGVEQIGHVYEGLLEFSCCKVGEPFLGLAGKAEPEVALAELESVATQGDAKLRQWLQSCCDATEKQVQKWLAADPSAHQRADLHTACDNDAALAERVLPFWGLLRIDLRGHPTVFPAGSVLFTQVGDRRSTGTHYTPRELAEEVVEHTLAPLCFTPGPAQGAERGVWRAKKAHELLALKIVDPAMGSGAFLVSACRYLADRVVEAWDRDGVPEDDTEVLGAAGDHDELLLLARRKVAARCLYGVDRDDMAVELAKLSLWLVTLAKNKPFGFLDHALRCGDSLIGLVSEQQVAAFHLDADRGWSSGTDLFRYLNEHIDAVLTDVAEIREHIESTVVQDARDAASKAEQLRNAEWMTRKLRLAADAVVGAALSTAVRHAPWYEEDDDEDLDDRLRAIADDVDLVMRDIAEISLEDRLRATIDGWLRGGRLQPIHPLHWPLEFPEVMRRGGFDAVVGNPPFIGGQRVTGAIGKDVREYLIEHLGWGKRGSADLCSYFLLRDLGLSWRGRVGIIATNTIAQGDTREVGLDQAISNGASVYRAVKSQRWPGTASLEVSLLWVGHASDNEPRILDGHQVLAITPSLDPRSRVSGNPHRLAANAEQSFQGSNILGLGFIVTPGAARALIDKNPRNKDVLFPYLNGDDLNSQPDCSADRWVINFHDWSIEDAQQYEDCFRIIEEKVKPFRAKNKDPRRRDLWWRFTRPTMELYEAIDGLRRVLVIAQTSRTQMPCLVPAGQVFDQKLVVFPVSEGSHLCFRSSAFQYWWTVKNSSTMKADTVYAPSDCCENLPVPKMTERMDRVGEELHSFRRFVMLEKSLGLTKLYKQVYDPTVTEEAIQRLREIHTEIDYATADAYGWGDLDLGHGFHNTRQGRRFTIAPQVQVEVLDRLLELNHERYTEEVRQGLPAKKKAKLPKKTAQHSSRHSVAEPEDSLF